MEAIVLGIEAPGHLQTASIASVMRKSFCQLYPPQVARYL
jgi:hypothetical protein